MADAGREDKLHPIAVPAKTRAVGVGDRGAHQTIGRSLRQENRNVRGQDAGRILLKKAPPWLLIGEIVLLTVVLRKRQRAILAAA